MLGSASGIGHLEPPPIPSPGLGRRNSLRNARSLFLLLFGALAVVTANPSSARSPDDLLEPEKAFRLSVRADQASTLDIDFEIAAGYYLYRSKFEFAVQSPSVKLGAPEFPPGV